MASAQKELSLIQKGLLAKKLVGPDFLLPEVVQLGDIAEPGPKRPNRLDLYLPEAEEPYKARFQQRAEELYDLARVGLREAARL